MTTSELQRERSRTTPVARVRSTPAGAVDQVPGDEDASAYGPVEITWFPDRLTITVVGAGPASMTGTYLSGGGQDVTIEVRLPSLDELIDAVPGAD